MTKALKPLILCLHSRHGIPALKPAPIVASYLGYPGTVGANYTDYTIADRVSLFMISEFYSASTGFTFSCRRWRKCIIEPCALHVHEPLFSWAKFVGRATMRERGGEFVATIGLKLYLGCKHLEQKYKSTPPPSPPLVARLSLPSHPAAKIQSNNHPRA